MAFFIEVGLLLIVVPWSTFWQHNYFVQAMPALGRLIDDAFVRGAVTGLGVLNLFAGFAELAPVFSARDDRAAALRNRADGDAAYTRPDSGADS